MAAYTAKQVERILENNGEIMVVLDSGEQYELHTHDTSLDVRGSEDIVVKEGEIIDGHLADVEFPVSAIEHFIRHY